MESFNFLYFTTFLRLEFCLFLILLFFAKISIADNGLIQIREGKYYREIRVQNTVIFLDKKSLDFMVIDGNRMIKSSRSKFSRTFSFSFSEKGLNHYLIQNIGQREQIKIGYLLRYNQVQYKEDSACDIHIPYKESLSKIVDSNLIEKIKSFQIEKLFDEKSCGSISQEMKDVFKKSLIQSLNMKTSQLKRCAESKEAQSFFIKDTVLMQNGFEIFGRYFNLINSLSESKLKFTCGLIGNLPNKVASFSQNPLEIALNVINKGFNLKIDNLKTVLTHELIHYGSEQFKEKPNSSCLDEGLTNLFEAVCNFRIGAPEPQKTEQIVGECLDGIKNVTHQVNGHIGNKGGKDRGIAAAIAVAPRENVDQNRDVTIAIENTIESRQSAIPYQPIPDSTIQLAATAQVMTTAGRPISAYEGDGEFHQVVGDSSFTLGVQQLGQSLSNSMNNADHLLNSALGNVGKVAAAAAVGTLAAASSGTLGEGASSGGVANNKVYPLTATEIFANRYYPDSVAVQNALNNPITDKMTYDQKEAYYRSLGGSNSGSSAQLASVESTTAPKAASGNAKTETSAKNSVGGGGPTKAASAAVATRSVASVGGATSVDVPTGEMALKKTAAANGGVEAEGQATSMASSNIRLDNAIIQRLSAFSKVNEPAYSRVAERFADETFQRQLNIRKIRIVGEDGRPLWASAVQPQRCFRDNKTTKVLEVVACK